MSSRPIMLVVYILTLKRKFRIAAKQLSGSDKAPRSVTWIALYYIYFFRGRRTGRVSNTMSK